MLDCIQKLLDLLRNYICRRESRINIQLELPTKAMNLRVVTNALEDPDVRQLGIIPSSGRVRQAFDILLKLALENDRHERRATLACRGRIIPGHQGVGLARRLRVCKDPCDVLRGRALRDSGENQLPLQGCQ